MKKQFVWIDKALEIDPENVSPLLNKGFALKDLARYEEPLTWYDKALEIDPNNEELLELNSLIQK